MVKIMIIFGTRPEIIKMAPLIREIEKRNLECFIIHTGQHYDYNMSQAFIKSLKLKNPDINLNVGSDLKTVQISKMISKIGKCVLDEKPDIVLAQGDTNSVLAASLVCSSLGVAFGHVEAGIRSFDLTMPEEINRRITGVASNFHFAPSENAVFNLLLEGIEPKRIFLTGNTIVDATIQHLGIAQKLKSEILNSIYEFTNNSSFILCTLHRPSNVDRKESLVEILEVFKRFEAIQQKIVFPIHPRTVKRLQEFNLWSDFQKLDNLFLTDPVDYLSFIKLLSDCSIVLTDSGGIQEEAVTLRKRCVTLRTNTERPETIKLGVNILCKTKKEDIIQAVKKQLVLGEINEHIPNPYGNGDSARKIIDILLDYHELYKFEPPITLDKGTKCLKLLLIETDVLTSDFEKENGTIIMVFNEKGDPILKPKYLKSNYSVMIRN